MPEISKDVVVLLQYLLPGFLAAWVFYGLTSHQKPDQFERTVQALIFSLVVQAMVIIERSLLEWIGHWWSISRWGGNSNLFASLSSGLGLGFIMAYTANKDTFHKFLRDNGYSKRSSHPSEWYESFSQYPRFVVLHMKDDRRLYGWPKIWPSDSKKGSFFVIFPSWLKEDNTQSELETAEGLLIDVNDVRWVEFVKEPESENVKT